jgi:two-component system sensor histidine kinase DesK
VRHAGARHATIRIVVDQSSVVLEVTDDGRGGSGTEGAGMTGMRERITALGGTVQRDGRSGMHVRVSLPVEASTRIAAARTSESSGHP